MARPDNRFRQGTDLSLQGFSLHNTDFRWKGSVDANGSIQYFAGDVVIGSNDTLYRAVQTNDDVDPTTDDGSNWITIAGGGSATNGLHLVLTAQMDLTTTTLTGTSVPSSLAGFVLALNGVVLVNGVDYTYTRPTITFTNQVLMGDRLEVWTLGVQGAQGEMGNPGMNGQDGSQGPQGRFRVNLFQRGTTAPAVPSDLTYTPATDTVTNAGGWSLLVPTGTEQLYEIEGDFDPAGSATTITSWSTPFIAGAQGPAGPPGPPGPPGPSGGTHSVKTIRYQGVVQPSFSSIALPISAMTAGSSITNLNSNLSIRLEQAGSNVGNARRLPANIPIDSDTFLTTLANDFNTTSLFPGVTDFNTINTLTGIVSSARVSAINNENDQLFGNIFGASSWPTSITVQNITRVVSINTFNFFNISISNDIVFYTGTSSTGNFDGNLSNTAIYRIVSTPDFTATEPNEFNNVTLTINNFELELLLARGVPSSSSGANNNRQTTIVSQFEGTTVPQLGETYSIVSSAIASLNTFQIGSFFFTTQADTDNNRLIFTNRIYTVPTWSSRIVDNAGTTDITDSGVVLGDITTVTRGAAAGQVAGTLMLDSNPVNVLVGQTDDEIARITANHLMDTNFIGTVRSVEDNTDDATAVLSAINPGATAVPVLSDSSGTIMGPGSNTTAIPGITITVTDTLGT